MKKGISISIIALFIVSVVSPIVIGGNAICRGDNAFCCCVEDDLLDYNYGEEQLRGTISDSTDEDEISYYDPDTLTNVIGLTNTSGLPIYWSSAVRFTPEELSPYAGSDLIKVIVALSCEDGQTEVYANLTIYGEGTPTEPGSVMYEENEVYFDATDWYTIELNESILLGKYDIWIAMTWKQTEDPSYIAFADGGPAVDGKGDWIRIGDGDWSELQIYGLDYNWGMGAVVRLGHPSFLSISNVRGLIGVKADVMNLGCGCAHNLEWSMNITGGTFGLVNKYASGNRAELPVDAIEVIWSGLFFGLGRINIEITADAYTAIDETTKTKSAFLLGPFVLGIE